MILNLGLAGLHLHRPTLAEVKTVARFVGVGALIPAAVLVAGTALVWPALVAVAALLGVTVGSHRTGKQWQRRYESFAASVDRNNQALHLMLANYERVTVERFNAEVAERNGRWIDLNDSRRPAASNTNTSQEIN